MATDDQDFVVLGKNDILDFNDAGLLSLSEEKITKIHAWLKPTEYAAGSSEYAKHKASHLAGTGTWILDTDEYQKWHKSDHGTLWIKAIAGAGKSVLAASVISKLVCDEQVPVLYFFFRHIISTNQKPQSLIRDYLSQVLQNCPSLQHGLYRLVKAERSLESMSVQELWDMLVTALMQLPRVYCVVDALDEMDSENQSFLQDLVALGQKAPRQVKVLMTSRPVPRVEQILQRPDVLQVRLQARLVDPDISAYVRHRVKTCPVSETIRSLIHERMCVKANGHFLYARLMMDDLLDPSKTILADESNVLSVLESLPTPMAGMYTKMLLDHARRSRVPQEVQVAILCWITRAERPLRLLELCSIFDPNQKAFEMSKDTKTIVREACGPLVEIFEDETVHPIHHSFTEYLYDATRQGESSQSETFPVLNYTNAQRTLSLSCIRYLASIWNITGDDKIDRSKCGQELYQQSLKLKYPFLTYAANNFCSHLRKYDLEDTQINAELDALVVGNSNFLTVWLELIKPHSIHDRDWSGKRFQHWTPLHAAADQGLTQYVGHLLTTGHTSKCSGETKISPAELAAKRGHVRVLEALLNAGVPYDQLDNLGMTFLHHAALNNHPLVAKLLLNLGADPMAKRTKDNPGRRCGTSPSAVGDTPVKYACRNGHMELVKVLIPYLNTDGLQNALYIALDNGKSTIAKTLLRLPGIDVNDTVHHRTLLYLATKQGDLDLMGLLISMGAQVRELNTDKKLPNQLMWGNDGWYKHIGLLHTFATSFAQLQREKFVDWTKPEIKEGFRMLLDAGADPNVTKTNGRSVLHTLVMNAQWPSKEEPRDGIDTVLSLLLERGLSATLLTRDGSNALHCASRIPARAIDLLLKHGVDINQVRSSDGKTPLMTAVEKNDLSLLQHLIDRGAKVDVRDYEGNSPLHLIANLDEHDINYDMVKLLLLAGIDVHSKNRAGNTAMYHWDVKMKLLKLFLEHNFDMETKNKEGLTVLHQSVLGSNHNKHYEQLMELGADPLTKDSQGRNILHTILRRNSLDRSTRYDLEFFIQKGIDPLATDGFGNTLWHSMAVGKGNNYPDHLALMNLLMKHKVSPVARNLAGQTPVHLAFSTEPNCYKSSLIEFLLEHTQADVNSVDCDGIAPIHLAASFSARLTSDLLQLGADPLMATIEGQNALMIACRNRQCDTVYMLLDHYRSHNLLSLIDQVDRSGRSALHYACRSGRPESVAPLVDAGAQVRLKDSKGSTPLDLCSEYLIENQIWLDAVEINSSYSEMRATNVLLTDKTRPKLTNYYARPDPIRIRQTIRLLIANGADVSFLTQKSDANLRSAQPNPLSLSLTHRCEAMTSELLRIQDNLVRNVSADTNNDSLHSDLQCEQEIKEINSANLRCFNALDQYENRIRLSQVHRYQEMVAEIATPHENNMDVMTALLDIEDEPAAIKVKELGADFIELNNAGENPLFKMASWGYADLLRKIGRDAMHMTTAWVEDKAPQNVNWRGLKCILYQAVTRELPNIEVVRLLITEFKLNVNEVFLVGSSYQAVKGSFVHLLASSSRWWQLQALEILLQNGAQVDLPNSKGETALITALAAAASSPKASVALKKIEILLRHGANPNAVDRDGSTCLNLAGGRLSFVKLLLQYGAEPSSGSRPFIFDAILAQNLELMQCIMDSGIDVNCRATGASTASTTKTLGKVTESTTARMPSNIAIIGKDDLCKHAYPIHLAASHLHNRPKTIHRASKIIEVLLRAGADPFRIYEDGESILHKLAEQNGILEPFLRLPEFDLEAKDVYGRTLLLAACDSPGITDRQCATAPWDVILENGGSIWATDNAGCNALHHLMRRSLTEKHSSLVQKLIPDLVTKLDDQGRAPFHFAMSAHRFEFLDAFLYYGADPLIADPSDGSTALHHIASILDRIDFNLIEHISEAFPDKGLTFQQIHSDLARNTPHVQFAELLKRGVPINAEDFMGDTALFKLVATLASHAMHHYGDSDLDVYSWRSTLQVFEDAGANFVHRNRAGQSLLHVLAMQKGTRSRFQQSSWNRTTPRVLNEVWTFLVDRGVDVRWEDDGHRTCLDVAAVAGSQWVLDIYKRK